MINNKNESISEVLDKYNVMKICGLDELIRVSSKLELVENRIEVICILQV